MADHAVEDFDGDTFIYRGGQAPQHITHARIDKSANEVEREAFDDCVSLLQVDTRDGLRRIRTCAFRFCRSLRRINLKSAVEIDAFAFYGCKNLADVEFGDRLETIGYNAFDGCDSLSHLKLPSVITIGGYAFLNCTRLIHVELSERLETIGGSAFYGCERLQRIVIPLKRDLFAFDQYLHPDYSQFDECEQLTTVDLVGGIHTTVASLHMDSWRTDMIAEINRINQVLPNTPADEKTEEIRQWMEMVLDKMDHYKAEHCRFVREGMTLLELALWKAKLGETKDKCGEGRAKKAKVDTESARKERRVTCGADIVIKNVLPFLQLK